MAMTIVMPIPTIAEIDARTITPLMFQGVKNRGLSIAKMTTTTISEATAAAESAAKICLPMRLMRFLSTRHASKDLFLAGLLRDQFSCDPAVAQDIDSARQPHEFRDFGGTYKDCNAARRELLDCRINLFFRSNVNAAGRLGEQEQLGLCERGSGEQDFLLIAAAQRSDHVLRAPAADAERLLKAAKGTAFGGGKDPGHA
jgi:hypothetical protein